MKSFGPVTAMLALGLWATAAFGDGGSVLLHQDAGPFTITLFAHEPLTAGANDLSSMVQKRDGGDLLTDAVIEIAAVSQNSEATQPGVRLSQGQATNRMLQAATMRFAAPGKWRLIVTVHRGADAAQASTECTVEPDTSRASIVWFSVLLPVGVILIFLLHQFLRHKQSEGSRVV